jgi:hypothetical protein
MSKLGSRLVRQRFCTTCGKRLGWLHFSDTVCWKHSLGGVR